MIKMGNRRFLLFTLLLLFKCCLAWFVVFEDGPSWMTMLTEIPFFWLVFCLIEWFATKRKLLYYTIANLLFTLLYFTVLMYYKYYGIIVTYHAISQADKVAAVGNSTYSLMDPYYLLIFVDIIVLIVIPLSLRKKYKGIQLNLKPISRTALSVMFIISVTLCYFSIWPNRASMNENKQAEEMGILNYEVFTIFADSTEDAEMVEMEDITQPVIDTLKGIKPLPNPQYFGANKGKNVIILQMESFQNFLIGLKVGGKEVTPNMNKLAKENFHYDNFYTMVGQGTTSDAEYVVNTSLYVPKHQPATQDNVKKALPSLPKLMAANGYTTATFHTNEVQFWNRKELYSAIGWEKYYDKSFYGDDDHVAFGASDEVLYAKTLDELKKISKRGKPFYSQIISMSSHHPYNIPESKIRMDLPEELKDTLVGRYIQAQNYADYALGAFIDGLKQSGLWDNSIVLFYGDHQGLPVYSLDSDEQEQMKNLLGHEYGYTDMFKIPLIMHAPGVTYPALIKKTGGQIDILPTVANLTGISIANQIHFGQDLLNQSSNVLPMRHFLPSGSIVTDSEVFVPGIGFEDGTNYPLDILAGSTGATLPKYENALELLNLSDSYVKQLPDKAPAEKE
ncbi:phosphoglycerol transferase MdoB-like AlkP superfamily enzyme [Cohnella lupini]|uniref:Phosphoglycerol transferase MdoB-like AlkP superfamily enzyme n=1 Tax=Cohnella lupini TaxID=1294267 RepID=A0A3D9I948_9BACL|nr:phosphoglycerol transferase MdoB-like AlkP superfamily enzyme [Cohnella lupini]